MNTCTECKQPMETWGVCLMRYAVIEGKVYQRDTGHFREPEGYCHDCNAMHGSLHHPGCDVERCPKCGGQSISCGCIVTEYRQEAMG